MKIVPATLLACLLPSTTWGKLVGYGLWPYKPVCAFACDRSLTSYMLECSTDMAMGSGMDMSGDDAMTTAACRASDTPWLQTLAWCVHTKCAQFSGIAASELERFWETQCTGDSTVAPKWTFGETLANISSPPTVELSTDTDTQTLNFTALVNADTWLAQYNALYATQHENVVESGYSIAIIVVGFGAPLVLTWLSHVPYMTGILDKIKPFLIWPSAIGTYQVRPLPHLLGNAPTIGQSLLVVLYFILILILCAVNYTSKQPNDWFSSQHEEILAYVFYRTGTFAFVLAPLTILFSSRNNILLWMTNWSHSTYLVLHRWVARIFALLALLHTLLALPIYYPADATEDWWIWGAVATVALMILVVASGLYVRKLSYEVFLITHVVLTVIVIVGCWYHVTEWIGLTWGYETWLYAASAVWFFDRLARVGRILKNGMRRAKVTEICDGHVRVDIEDVRWATGQPQPGKHVFAFFPTLDPHRPWENHPFSVVPTSMLRPLYRESSPGDDSRAASSRHADDDVEGDQKNPARAPAALEINLAAGGLTLFIKRSKGITRHLWAQNNLLTLLDGPYPSNPTDSVLRCDRLLLIGGGIGITSLIPWASGHWNVKLCWSLKESAKNLTEELGGFLSRVADKEVMLGRRLVVDDLLAQELDAGWRRVGVVVSGPAGLCDDVRAAVTAAGRRQANTIFELEVDAYTW